MPLINLGTWNLALYHLFKNKYQVASTIFFIPSDCAVQNGLPSWPLTSTLAVEGKVPFMIELAKALCGSIFLIYLRSKICEMTLARFIFSVVSNPFVLMLFIALSCGQLIGVYFYGSHRRMTFQVWTIKQNIYRLLRGPLRVQIEPVQVKNGIN